MYDVRNLTISSSNPCLILYLIDQSGSMNEKFGNNDKTKAQELANAINDTIYELGLRSIGNSGEVKNRFEIAIMGYGKNSNTVESGWEGSLANKWVVSIKDVFDYPIDIIDDKPIWLLPYSNNDTPMTKAFENATRLCQDWIEWGNHDDCHPPIVINISDGEATDTDTNHISLKKQVAELKSSKTNYGNIIVLNIHISSSVGDKYLFPNELIGNSNPHAKLMFELSSDLTPNMIEIANKKGYSISNNAKGYIYNGNGIDLINFLNIGSPV